MAKRLRFPDDESRQPWLALLLEAYGIVDEGLAAAVRQRELRTGTALACREGCSACCKTHRDIPVYPLELVGIYWYVVEKLEQSLRTALKRRLFEFQPGDACPFLHEDSCSIHPLRPLACRHFNVFGTSCGEGEDAFHSRRSDVLAPPREMTDRAFAVMLPFYGITEPNAIERAVRMRLTDSLARVLQRCPWNELALRMEEFDLAGKTKRDSEDRQG